MSGSGTSGRVAYLVATMFNKILEKLQKPKIFKYLISGKKQIANHFFKVVTKVS